MGTGLGATTSSRLRLPLTASTMCTWVRETTVFVCLMPEESSSAHSVNMHGSEVGKFN